MVCHDPRVTCNQPWVLLNTPLALATCSAIGHLAIIWHPLYPKQVLSSSYSCILDGPTQVSAWKLSWPGSYRQYSPITNTQQQPTRCSHITEHAHGLRNLLNGNQLEFLNVRKWKRKDLCLVAVLVLPPFIKPSGTELIILIGRDAMAGLQSVKIINSSIYHCDVLYTILLCTQYNTKWSHCLKRSRYLRAQF